jgi:hypothetical protein
MKLIVYSDSKVVSDIMCLRLFFMPVLLLIVGISLAVGLYAWATQVETTVLLDLAITAKLISLLTGLGSLLIGAGWLLLRLQSVLQWKRGTLNGGCQQCHGLLSHHDDEHGFYSKCRMCNARQ